MNVLNFILYTFLFYFKMLIKEEFLHFFKHLYSSSLFKKIIMKPLNIIVTTDNQYIILLAALIKSIEINIRINQKINIYIIEDNVSIKNKEKLHTSIDKSKTELIWKKMSLILPKDIKLPLDKTTYPLNIYMRLFIPYFMADDIEKALYLDVDMIVQSDITNLFNYDLNDYCIGAVQDPSVLTFNNSWGGVINYQELRIAGDTKYFNTGLLLMNIKKWKDQNLTEQIINCIDNNIKYANYPDQYGLNVVLANQWLELDPLWNHFCTIEHPNPYIIHFVRRKPIYKSYNNNEIYRKTFFKYLKMTEWKNFKPIGEPLRYFKKIKNVMNKIRQ